MKRPVLLFSTPILQHPPMGGPALRIENSIKALARIADVHVVCRCTPEEAGGAPARAYLERHGASLSFAPPPPRPRGWRRFVRKLRRSWSKRVGGCRPLAPGAREEAAALLARARAVGADALWLGYGNISYPLLAELKRQGRLPVVLDTDSVWSRYVLRGAAFAATPAERARIEAQAAAKAEEERWGTALADVTTAVSELDARHYRTLATRPGQVHVFSNVIDVEGYHPLPPPAPGLARPCLYLAGSWWPSSPMEDAGRWLLAEVWPRLREAVPDLHLYLVGKGSREVLHDVSDPRVHVTGPLPSVLPWLAHCDVALVPLRFESGTRYKILEAGACGAVVVSTTLGAEGIPVEDGVDIRLADDPADFARAVLDVLADPEAARAMGLRLQARVRAEYGLDVLEREGRRILEVLLPS